MRKAFIKYQPRAAATATYAKPTPGEGAYKTLAARPNSTKTAKQRP